MPGFRELPFPPSLPYQFTINRSYVTTVQCTCDFIHFKGSIVMGCTSSKAVDDEGRIEKGDYIAKQNVTIWNYLDGGDALKPFPILENARVEVGD